MLHCTSLLVPPGSIVRDRPRPVDLRQPDYDDAFDATTWFYDVFALPEPYDALVFVGPPLLNLLPVFYDSRLNGNRLATARSTYYARDRCCDVWVQEWKGGGALLDTPVGSFELMPQAAAHPSYAGKRVLYTLSKDNEIEWIRDWVRFHARNHGADAVLLYDNDSSRYTGEELEDTLRTSFPRMEIHVVHWPFRYGPQGVSASSGWDSDFCQAGAFQDARFRFLTAASSVLNCDIDELVVGPGRASVFEAAERSRQGYVTFTGRWISGARRSPPPPPAPACDLRHGQFVFTGRDDDCVCPTKWCAVPARCALDVHWSTHSIQGMDGRRSRAPRFSYRHFRSISTNWKYPRHGSRQATRRHHRFDRALARALAGAGLRPHRPSGPRPGIGRQLRSLVHPDVWRS